MSGSRRAACAAALALAAGVLATSACQSREQRLAEAQADLRSLRATTAAIGEAWLAGAVSSRYARTALEAVQELLEKQRAGLAGSAPDALADPAARALIESQDRLARSLARLWTAVGVSDPAAVRRQLSEAASRPREAP